MATPFIIFLQIIIAAAFITSTTAIGLPIETETETSSVPISSPSLSPSPPFLSPPNLQESSSLITTSLLEPILTNLGFQELAMAAPSLSDSALSSWDGPFTLFAPSDLSIRNCFGGSCSVARILREHIVPGLFASDYLRKLEFGTKIETISRGRCITVTSTIGNSYEDDSKRSKIFIEGAEITHSDLFNNGLIIIHRLEGTTIPLSPFSCNIERMRTSPLSSSSSSSSSSDHPRTLSLRRPGLVPSTIMRLMLRDATLRLRNNGFSVLSLALRMKSAELVHLHNMTVFALDDSSIFSGGQAYVSNVRYHIVPNMLLRNADLAKLPAGTVLDTMERGQTLVVTSAAELGTLRINYVRIKAADVMYNAKLVVHNVYLPFPRIHPASAFGGIGGSGFDPASSSMDSEGGTYVEADMVDSMEMGSCIASDDGDCAMAPTQDDE